MARWEDVRPILVAAYDVMDKTYNGLVDGRDVADALGRPHDDLWLGRDLEALAEADYLKCAIGGTELPIQVEGTEKGRQEVEGWPGARSATGSVDLLVALLAEREEAPDTPSEERSKLRALREVFAGTGTDIASKALAEVIVRSGGVVA